MQVEIGNHTQEKHIHFNLVLCFLNFTEGYEAEDTANIACHQKAPKQSKYPKCMGATQQQLQLLFPIYLIDHSSHTGSDLHAHVLTIQMQHHNIHHDVNSFVCRVAVLSAKETILKQVHRSQRLMLTLYAHIFNWHVKRRKLKKNGRKVWLQDKKKQKPFQT